MAESADFMYKESKDQLMYFLLMYVKLLVL